MIIRNGVLPLIMGNYAQNFGVKLYMYGHYAYTDGCSITIPRLDLDDSESLELAYGYVAHECGHIKYSDFKIFPKGINDEDTLFNLYNSIEDVRIEYLQIRNWPGLEKTFNYLVDSLSKSANTYVSKAVRNKNIATLLIMYCSAFCRFYILKQKSLEQILNRTKKHLSLLLGNIVVLQINNLLKDAHLLKTSSEIKDISDKIIKLVKSVVDLFKNYSINECKFLSEDIETFFKITDSTNLGSLKDLDKTFIEKYLKEKGFSNFNKLETSLNKIIDRYRKYYTKSYSIINFTDNILKERPSVVELLSEKSFSENAIGDYGSTVAGDPVPADSLKLYDSVLKNNGLRHKLHNLIKGYDVFCDRTYCSGKKLNIREYFIRNIVGYKHIFFKEQIKKTLNTRIYLLVDISGSMLNYFSKDGNASKNKRRYEVSNHVALSLALAINGLKHVTSEVVYFPGVNSEYEVIYKVPQSLISRVAYFDQKPRGCTPLAQAILHTIGSINQTTSLQRNIIIVITDGEPDSYSAAKFTIKKVKQLNAEVYGLLIGCQKSYPNLFDDYKDINDANELPKALYELLKSKMYKF